MAYRNTTFDVEPAALHQLLGILAAGQAVGIVWQDGKFTVRIGCTPMGGRVASSRSLAAAMADLQGIVRRTRKCAGPCKQENDLVESFGRLPGPKHSGGNDGYNRYCKACEHARVKEYEARKRFGRASADPSSN